MAADAARRRRECTSTVQLACTAAVCTAGESPLCSDNAAAGTMGQRDIAAANNASRNERAIVCGTQSPKQTAALLLLVPLQAAGPIAPSYRGKLVRPIVGRGSGRREPGGCRHTKLHTQIAACCKNHNIRLCKKQILQENTKKASAAHPAAMPAPRQHDMS